MVPRGLTRRPSRLAALLFLVAPLPLRNSVVPVCRRELSTGDYDRLRFASVALVSLSLSPALSAPLMAAKQPRRSVGHRRNGVTIAQKGTQQRVQAGGTERETERETRSQPAAGQSLSRTRRVVRERQPAE